MAVTVAVAVTTWVMAEAVMVSVAAGAVTVSVTTELEPPEGATEVTAGTEAELVSVGDTPEPGVLVGTTVTTTGVPEMTVDVT